MARAQPSPGAKLATAWRRLHRLPGGKALFSRFLGWSVPYTGTVGARITELEAGHVRAELRDRRKVRNHLDCVHAVALVNLGELVSGLATLTALPAGVRGIVTRLDTVYFKKARGRLVAESRSAPPAVDAALDHQATADIRDASGDVVARVTATWRLSPPTQGAA